VGLLWFRSIHCLRR